MFKTFKIAFLALMLGLASAPVFADSCDQARVDYDRSDAKFKSLLGNVISGVDRVMGASDQVELQKRICKGDQALLDLMQDNLQRMRNVDNACGSRIYWKGCDTACTARRVAEQRKKVKHECDPARIPEIIEAAKQADEKRRKQAIEDDKHAKEEAEKAIACTNLNAYQKRTSSAAEWAGWVKACNEADREFDLCVSAWLSLEKEGMETTGLTCRPTAKQRADAKKAEAAEEAKKKTPEYQRSKACDELIFPVTGDKTSKEELVRLCNDAPAVSCGAARKAIEDLQHKPNPGLTCRKVEL